MHIQINNISQRDLYSFLVQKKFTKYHFFFAKYMDTFAQYQPTPNYIFEIIDFLFQAKL